MGVGPLKLAILDRDGTIVESVLDAAGATTSAFSPGDLRFLPDAIAGLHALSRAGFVLAIATNQPGPAKGQATREQVARTNAALVARLAERGVAIAAVEVCLHHPVGGPAGEPELVRACECRKPRPGMLTALLERLHGDAARSWMIGDSPVDVEAGRAAALRTAVVGPYRGEITPDLRAATLLALADEIARER
ncbi:MAG: D-glycero-alpha-D-manno-heptose-1,7-bisphosphate 7-phosphatase [Acidobacteriota bacterium]